MADIKPVTMIAVFDDRRAAEQAVVDLEQAGFRSQELGYILPGSESVQGGMITDATGVKDRTGAISGMVTGGMVGGILAAAVALVLPGIGPIVAGGVLASFFGGAIAGTAIGGILGALRGLGLSEEEAARYDEQFQAGKAIVAVRPGIRAVDAAEILRRHGGYDIHNTAENPLDTKGFVSQA
jgi:hypothetical protein